MAINTSALSFDGVSNHYVTLNSGANLRALDSFTFMCWFKVGAKSTSMSQHAYVERQGTGSGIRFRFTPIRGSLNFGFSAKDGTSETNYKYKTNWDDRWHHAAFTVRMTGAKPTYQIYLDSVSVADGTLVIPSGTEAISDTQSLGIYVGNHNRGSGFQSSTAWEGKIDDIIILKEATSQQAISEYFSSRDDWKLQEDLNDPEREPLKHYWAFDENGSTSTRDKRGNLYGTLSTTNLWDKDRPYLGNGQEDKSPPTTPTNPKTTAINHDGFTASWGASTDNVFVQFYELQVSEYSNFSSYDSYVTGQALSHVVRDRLPAVNYYWRVHAFDASLNKSNYTATQSLTTPPIGDNAPPLPPTNLAAAYITHSSFRLNFTQSTSNDTAGYKLDIATDPYFDNYLIDYRNRDIGNVSSYNLFGLEPLTSYYVRLRAYDGFDNESLASSILRVNTIREPDITPPEVVTLREPSAISSTSATIGWEPGVDNVGVTGYYLDISTNAAFNDYVATRFQTYQDLDVGNITRLRVDGLEAETEYYYRVRAYDEAGNVSNNPSEPIQFVTDPPSMYEAGYITTQEYPTDVTVAGPGEDISETPRNPEFYEVTPDKKLYLQYDLTDLVGSLQGAIFTFKPRNKGIYGTLGRINVRMYQGEIDSDIYGQSLEFNITQFNEEVELDVSSLLTSGANIYSIEISSMGFIGFIDSGFETTEFSDEYFTSPTVTTEADPTTSTQPLDMIFRSLRNGRTNLQNNNSFEVNTNGWTTGGGGTISVVSNPSAGSQAVQLMGTGAAHMFNYPNVSSQPTVSGNSTYTVSFDARRLTGPYTMRAALTARTSSGTDQVSLITKSFPLLDTYNRYSLTALVPQTHSKLGLVVYLDGASDQEGSILVDNVLVELGSVPGAAFNGDSFGALWRGGANNSPSFTNGTYFEVESPFLGDSNQNNSARAFFRNVNDTEGWIESYEPVVLDRELNIYRTNFGPSIGNYNLIKNPSFEADSHFWTGGTRTEEEQQVGDWSYHVPTKATYTERILVEPNTTYQLLSMIKSTTGGYTIARIREYTTTSTGGQANVFTQVSDEAYGAADVWRPLNFAFTTAATTNTLEIEFEGSSSYFLDAVQLTKSKVLVPYRDGSVRDGVWEGIPHRSTSGIHIQPNEVYSIMFAYTDPEGFFDTENATYFESRGTFEVPAPPDDVTTVFPMELSAFDRTVYVEVPYEGDDNENNTARIEFKRTDLSQWSEVRPSYDRLNKVIRTVIPGMRHGTSYTVRAFVSDPDGVYGAVGNMVMNTITTGFPQESVDSEPRISFGGFSLMGRPDGKVAVTYHNAFGFPTRRVENEALPRQDGSVERQSPWGDKIIQMRGFISGNSRADLDDVKGALTRALAPALQRLVIDTLSQKGRYYNATCESLVIEENAEQNITHLEWEATFSCPDPFAYDMEESSVPQFSAPNNGQISINNRGDAVIFPYLQVKTQSSYPVTLTLHNLTTGDRITPKVTIVRGDVLDIDCERKSLTKNGVEVDYSGSFIRFSVGGNTLQYSVSAKAGTPTVDTSMRWRHKYL